MHWTIPLLVLWSCNSESICDSCKTGSKVEIETFDIAIPQYYNYKIYDIEKILIFSDTSNVNNVIGVIQIIDGINNIDSMYDADLANFIDDPTFIIEQRDHSKSNYFFQYANIQDADTSYSDRYYSKVDNKIVISEISSSYSYPKNSPEYCSVYCSIMKK